MGDSPLKRSHPPENGIAIGPILFVVALLAVLASAIAAGSGAFNSDTSEVKIKAQATAILGYVDELQIGVDRVMSRCPDTQISLANSVDSGYAENPLAPSDKSCHIFDVNGGGILFKEPPPDVDLTAVPAEIRHYFIHTKNQMQFFGQYVPVGVSSAGNELVILLPGVKKELCLKINDMVGAAMQSGDAPISNAFPAIKVWNYWTDGGVGWYQACGVPSQNKSTCCTKVANNTPDTREPLDSYVFWHILHVR